ncbi:MAG: glycosyltransferase [Limnochordaceae bacterium]|nr:glycosyltransferase [Limnochordaceae bacterium]
MTQLRLTVVYPPTLDWGWMTQRPQQISLRLARRGIGVVYCNLTQRPGRPLEPISPNLWICHDFEALKRQPVPGAVVWASWGRHWPLFGRWNALLNVFDNLDDFESWERDDREAAARADLVLATSRLLFQRWAARRPHVYLVPNGCDFEHFHRAAVSPPLPEPPDLAGIPRPRVLYMGALAPWLDAAAIEALVATYPGTAFVFIGASMGYEPPRRSNVHVLGLKPYEALPSYLAHCDAGLIPFRPERVTKAANPVKLYEYLAAGLPVLASRLPELEPYAGVVHLAGQPPEWAALLPAALADTSAARREQRAAVARANTWDDRVDQIVSLLHKAIAVKQARESASAVLRVRPQPYVKRM